MDDERFWDGAFGLGLKAWNPETVVDSVYASSPATQAIQLILRAMQLILRAIQGLSLGNSGNPTRE